MNQAAESSPIPAERQAKPAATADQALRASELNYHRLFEMTQDGILILDAETGRVNDVNPFLIKILGFTRSEMVGKTVAELSPFKDLVSNQAMLELLQKDRYVRYHHLPLETKDGRTVDVEFVSNMYQVGEKTVIQCSIREITDRKQAEEALRASQQMIGEIINALPARVFWKDKNLVYLGCNTTFARDAGFAEPKDIIGKNDHQMVWREQAEGYRSDDRQVIESGHPKLLIEESQTTPAGKTITLLSSKLPLRDAKGEIIGVLGTYLDITARKNAERDLRLFRALIEHSNDGIEVVDPESGRLLDVNETTCQQLGYTREELLSMRVADLENVAVEFSNWGKHVEQIRQAGFMILEGQHKRKDGSTFPIEVSIRYIKLERDYLLASVRDITERKQAEESHARLAMAVEQAAETIVITDIAPKILYANPAFEKSSGYTRAEALGQNPRILKSGKQDAEFYRQMWAVLGRGETWNGHFINKRKDGTLYEEEATISPVRDAAGTIVNFVAVKRDVTHEMQLEAQFRQAQKMESFGQLAGGVAHDFNNILAVIQMQSDLLRDDGRLTPEQLDGIAMIGEATQRATDLTRQLLIFSRKEKMQPRDLDLNECINNVIKMLRRILGENFELQLKLTMKPVFLHADAGMLDQIMMNLLVNARDAMPKGGRLTIETAAVDFDDTVRAQAAEGRPGSFVCLSVSDNGCGIPAENLARIFEPFFTTKGVGKGTGLGLATVFGIVQQHQGWVNVYSEVGLGTTFRIFFPRLNKMPAASQKTNSSQLSALRGGMETILLVEDDDSVRSAICNILSRLGYRLLSVNNAVKALEVWQERRDEIDLVLTDLVMPGGISGKDLGERLLQENPKVKVIYASGYSAEVVNKTFYLEAGVNFISKPFETQTLAQTIRNCLDAPAIRT